MKKKKIRWSRLILYAVIMAVTAFLIESIILETMHVDVAMDWRVASMISVFFLIMISSILTVRLLK